MEIFILIVLNLFIFNLWYCIVARMDIIFVNELKIETIIGIYDWERKTKQP